MRKQVLLSLSLILASFLFADTIVDSVYSDPILDGYLRYSQNSNSISVNNSMYEFKAGDGEGSWVTPDHNSYIRGFISFDLPEIPEGFHVDSVYVRLYQYYSTGNGYDDYFPEWDVSGGDTIKCIMSHVDYGEELDVEDWESGDVGNINTINDNIGIVTDSAIYRYRYLDITNSVINDYDAGRERSQYRIAFEINTDWDNNSDNVAFKTSNSSTIQHRPKLTLSFTDEVNSNDDNVIVQTVCINNYPNPFKPSGAGRSPGTTISYSLSQSGNVQLQIYNTKGQLIETLVDEMKEAGDHSVVWNAESQASGVYFYQIKTDNSVIRKKCILLK